MEKITSHFTKCSSHIKTNILWSKRKDHRHQPKQQVPMRNKKESSIIHIKSSSNVRNLRRQTTRIVVWSRNECFM